MRRHWTRTRALTMLSTFGRARQLLLLQFFGGRSRQTSCGIHLTWTPIRALITLSALLRLLRRFIGGPSRRSCRFGSLAYWPWSPTLPQDGHLPALVPS